MADPGASVASHFATCPAPWCALDEGHRGLHDIPSGRPPAALGARMSLTTKRGAHRRYVRLVRWRGAYSDVVGLGGEVRGVRFSVPTSNLVMPSPSADLIEPKARP